MTLLRMPRPVYVFYRLGESLLSSLSRFCNAAFFAGSTHQTISAQAFIESASNTRWARRQRFIDAIFFFQPDHCRWAWEIEVRNAKKTLERNKLNRMKNGAGI
jgi:hypothetical protein